MSVINLSVGHAGHSHSHSSMPHNHGRLTQLVSAGASATATDDNENDERFQPPQHYHDHVHHSHDSSAQMNMRGVFLHVMADALGSVIVIISAAVSVNSKRISEKIRSMFIFKIFFRR